MICNKEECNEFEFDHVTGEVLGALCGKLGVDVYKEEKDYVLNLIKTNLERQPSNDEASRQEQIEREKLVEKLAGSSGRVSYFLIYIARYKNKFNNFMNASNIIIIHVAIHCRCFEVKYIFLMCLIRLKLNTYAMPYGGSNTSYCCQLNLFTYTTH